MNRLTDAPTGDAIRIVHTADLHLGAGLTYGRIDPRTGLHERLLDQLGTLDQMVREAIERQADVFLVAGDIYHTKTPAPALTNEFAKRVHRLAAAGIHVVLLVGNHDGIGTEQSATALDVYASLEFPGVTVLRKPQLVTVQTRRGSLQVAAMPHLSKSVLDARRADMLDTIDDATDAMATAIDQMIGALARQVRPGIPAVLTAHLSLDVATVGSEGGMMVGRGLTLPLHSLQREGFQYVALGHIHKPQVFDGAGLPGLPPVVYPGSPERVSFDEAEDDKGFWLVDVAPGAPAQMERIPLVVRRFVTIDADLVDAIDPAEALRLAVLAADTTGAVVRLRYTIETERAALITQELTRRLLFEAFAYVLRPSYPDAGVRVRDAGMAEVCAADPRAALARYIDASPELAGRREALLAAAESLIASLAGEEPAITLEVAA
jgi:exonuclease SbcD